LFLLIMEYCVSNIKIINTINIRTIKFIMIPSSSDKKLRFPPAVPIVKSIIAWGDDLMKDTELKPNVDTMTAEINLMENALYIVCDGQITKVTAKKYGNDEIIWKDGKVLDVYRGERIRMNGQEVI
jgi:hypothetical protein